jgi:hypothetical protein
VASVEAFNLFWDNTLTPIFSRRTNLYARASILGGILLLGVIVGLLVWWVHSSTFTKVGVAVPQPVPYSHKLHVVAVGLNCRYCHDSVDKSAFANLPSTETCMTCHSQIAATASDLAPVRASWTTGNPIQWNRVNQLPDFVYFDHQIHIAKGVGCESCHGRVDTMTTDVKAQTFYMSFCVDCHRDPAKYLRPADQIYTMGYKPAGDQLTIGKQLMQEYNIMAPNQLTNCSICHR